MPPGKTLAETLETLGMTQVELAERMGRPLKTVNEIIAGKAAITSDTALQLEKVLNVPASSWTNHERIYRDTLARRRETTELEQQLAEVAQDDTKLGGVGEWRALLGESRSQIPQIARVRREPRRHRRVASTRRIGSAETGLRAV